MTGWLLSILLAGATALGLVAAARPGRGPLLLIGAVLLAGLAGFSWQAGPDLPGQPAAGRPHAGRETLFAQERKVWLETVGGDAAQLDGADAFIRNGDPAYAVGLLRAYLVREPGSMVLWLGLANALQAQAGGLLTPPARYALQKAAEAAPEHPAPAYFLGLAQLQMGDLESADATWRTLLKQAPAGAPWTARLSARIQLIERLRGNP